MAKKVGGKTEKQWKAFKADVYNSEVKAGKSPEKAEDIAYATATKNGWRRGAFTARRK